MSTKKTPLYDEHVKLGGKIVDYAGWELPVQYEGLVPEHEAVRNSVGIFDVSHMGEIIVKGKDAMTFLDYLMTNDMTSIVDEQIIYTMMCYPNGGVVDDLLIYRYSDENFYLVVNGANTDKDFEWITSHKGNYDVEIENISDTVGLVAVQGPNAEKTLQKLTDTDLSQIKYYHFQDDVDIGGVKAMVSRTGYTGEDGFEVYTDAGDIVKVWNSVFDAGKEYDIKPAGLGCRDTLRFESSLPLYGNEIGEDITPLEGGLKFFVKFDKESDFIGKEELKKQSEAGVTRRVVGIELLGKGIPREGYEIYKDGEKIGHITTGYMSPTLKKSIANAIIDVEHAALDTEVDVMIRKKTVPAKVISKKYLKK